MSKRIVILGARESGMGAALLAKSKGYDVFVSDAAAIEPSFKNELIENKINFEEFKHSIDKLKGLDLVIKSPGIPFDIPIIKKVQEAGIEIIDELEFAYRFTDKPIIAITGTNGKTTTTLLIHHLLTKSGINAGLAGNVGHSLARQVIKDEAEVYVVEMSSFQLDGIKTFRSSIAIILNITPDHLDRYNNNFELYAASKMRITENMAFDDYLIFNIQNKVLHDLVTYMESQANLIAVSNTPVGVSSAYCEDDELSIFDFHKRFHIKKELWPLKGTHNALNMCAAIMAAIKYGIKKEDVLAHLPSFKNIANRMEHIAHINEVEFVNDTKATNVEAVYYALGSYENIIWIAGGQDKGNDYEQIKALVDKKVKAMVCLGADNKKLTDFFEQSVSHISETKDVKEAARMALEYADKGDVVLLSPACASFDLFDNYAQRGDLFKKAVFELKSEIDG